MQDTHCCPHLHLGRLSPACCDLSAPQGSGHVPTHRMESKPTLEKDHPGTIWAPPRSKVRKDLLWNFHCGSAGCAPDWYP